MRKRKKSSAKSESLAISLCWKGYIVNEKEEEGRTEDGTLYHALNFNNKGLRWGVVGPGHTGPDKYFQNLKSVEPFLSRKRKKQILSVRQNI